MIDSQGITENTNLDENVDNLMLYICMKLSSVLLVNCDKQIGTIKEISVSVFLLFLLSFSNEKALSVIQSSTDRTDTRSLFCESSNEEWPLNALIINLSRSNSKVR